MFKILHKLNFLKYFFSRLCYKINIIIPIHIQMNKNNQLKEKRYNYNKIKIIYGM